MTPAKRVPARGTGACRGRAASQVTTASPKARAGRPRRASEGPQDRAPQGSQRNALTASAKRRGRPARAFAARRWQSTRPPRPHPTKRSP